MDKKALGAAVVALPLIIGGFVYANSDKATGSDQVQQAAADGYICPVTGEQLPCPSCCPLQK